jgi:cell division protein FtsN
MAVNRASARRKPARKKRATKSGATRNTEKSFSGVSWLMVIFVVGTFVAFLVYLDKIPDHNDGQQVVSPEKEKTTQTKIKKTPEKKPQFDFYTVLPDREVEVIENNARKPKPVKTITKTTAKAKPESSRETASQVKKAPKVVSPIKPVVQDNALYQLQVGAFNEFSKADAMKARLAFFGVESNIQVIRSKGQKMYRVRVGPSTDSKKINRIKAQLKAKNINTFLQKLKG